MNKIKRKKLYHFRFEEKNPSQITRSTTQSEILLEIVSTLQTENSTRGSGVFVETNVFAEHGIPTMESRSVKKKLTATEGGSLEAGINRGMDDTSVKAYPPRRIARFRPLLQLES